jgi:hypothetical protein
LSECIDGFVFDHAFRKNTDNDVTLLDRMLLWAEIQPGNETNDGASLTKKFSWRTRRRTTNFLLNLGIPHSTRTTTKQQRQRRMKVVVGTQHDDCARFRPSFAFL